jgi:hypothetical protein
MSRPSRSTVVAVLAGVLVGAFVLWLEAGPAKAVKKVEVAHFKVEIKGVQQMYSQHTHEAENDCDINDFSSGSEKLVFKTKPIVITSVHVPGVFNPSFVVASTPDGIPATAKVTRSYTPRISGGVAEGCGENDGNGSGEEVKPDCGTKTVTPFRLDLDYSEEEKSKLTLLGGLDEDPFHECPGVAYLSFPDLIVEGTNGHVIAADVSQDQLFDPEYGKWIALASGTRKVTEKDWWAKSTIHWDVSFTRLEH